MKTKLVSVIISLVIVTIIVLSGPAEAYILGLTIPNNEVEKGKTTTFSANFEIEQGEFYQINYLTLDLSIKKNDITKCKFNIDGSIISGCNGITIKQTSSINMTEDYGYGYESGYGKGSLRYTFTWDTTDYETATYSTQISIITPEKTIKKSGKNIKVIEGIPALRGCSLRASGGSFIIDGTDFGTPSLSFNIPLGNAQNGKGALTAQKGKNRISYQFDVSQIVSNDLTSAVVMVDGKYKIGQGKEVLESATITIDKVKKTASITDGIMKADNLKITFSKNCGI